MRLYVHMNQQLLPAKQHGFIMYIDKCLERIVDGESVPEMTITFTLSNVELLFSLYIFVSQLHDEHPRVDNQDLYYWAEITVQHTHLTYSRSLLLG